MNHINDTVSSILKHAFGGRIQLLDINPIKNGALTLSMKVSCDQHENPMFLKIEKDFDIPRTHKRQIRREASGIRLCEAKGISVPSILAADEEGSVCGNPWILEEAIPGKTIGESAVNNETKRRLGKEFETVFRKLLSIESDRYGDTFENGIVGQHASWKDTVTRINDLLLGDCDKLRIFDDRSRRIVGQALQKAVSMQKCMTRPAFFHYDLLSGNVFAEEREGEIYVGRLFDFGMSMFAPVHYVQYQTRKYTDFILDQMNVKEAYGVEEDELASYDILRLEPVVLLHVFQRHDPSIDPQSFTQTYFQKCDEYLYQD